MNVLSVSFIVLSLVYDAKSQLGEKRPSPPALPPLPDFVTQNILSSFEDWKSEFKTPIDINQVNGQKKLINYAKTVRDIEQQNIKFKKGEISFECRTNCRAILSAEEKRAYMNGFALDKVKSDEYKSQKKVVGRQAESKPQPQPSFPPAPDSLDYRQLGYVTEVVDQGFYCASCYAFSAQGAIEGAIFKKYGRLQKLSDQAIIDCNKNNVTGNWGCNGGWMGAVYEYVIGNNGTEAAATYPLQDVQYACKFSAKRTVARIESYGYIIGDEETVKRALAAIGPLSVGINGGINSFFNYWTGVYDDFTCSGNINHAVLLVGYGTDYSFSPPKDYWIIKNSWGKSWGENGFMRILRGKNLCGIINYVVYPIV